MNIDFQNITGQKSGSGPVAAGLELSKRQPAGFRTAGNISNAGYALDLDKSGFTDNAYKNPTRSMEDVAQMAQNTDATLQHNYMALLSNTVSEEDYGKAMEDGFDIKNMDSAEAVTIVDKIKSVMLEAGVSVEGYNDDLGADKLARITGSVTFANALADSFHENDIPLTTENVKAAKTAFDQIREIPALDDSAVKFMVLNNMQPTMENVYFASHSTNGQNSTGRGFYAQEASGYYAQKAESYDFEQLSPQIDKVITEAGLDTGDEEIQQNSRWMVKQGIPLTPENLQQVTTLKSISFPINEKIAAQAAASAIADGKKAIEGNLSSPESNLHRAAEIVKEVNNISDENIKSTIISGKEMNIKNLTEIPSVIGTERIPENDTRLLTARLQLEEVRLKMTTQANKNLLDSGFSIDPAPMEKLIERLKNALGQIGDEVSGRIVDEATDITPQNRGVIFSMTMQRVNVVREAPADLVGEMADEFKEASLFTISARAETMVTKFRQAGEGYEKLMTAPRADLGDSIKKAFRNVDDILKDLGEALTDENRRTVRILGYNQMEVSPENIEKVRSWDARLQATVSRLKPGAVMEMIKEGKNPLGMTIEELSQNLDQNSKDHGEQKGRDEERYARFLYKLERKGDVTDEEKRSFIGIYRLFHTLKETDYQAIGSLLKTDQKMTIGNLLNATRNQKASKRGMDYTVDDSFGGLSAKEMTEGARIDEQIESAFRYYRSKAEVVYDNLEPEKLKSAAPTNDTLLPELAQELQAADIDKELEKAFIKEEVRQIRQTATLKSAEFALEELKTMDIGITYNNLEAMIAVRRDRRNGNIWERIRDYKESKDIVDMMDQDDYEENYLKILDNISDKLSEELMNDTDSYIDVRSIALLQKQLSVMGQSAERESFEVPVEIDGETLSMHVTLKTERNSSSRMDARVQTYEYGQIAVSLYVDGDVVKGMLATTNGRSQEQAEYLENVRTRLCDRMDEKLKDIGVDRENIQVLYNTQGIPAGRSRVNTKATEGETANITDTQTLLKMAKAFVEAL